MSNITNELTETQIRARKVKILKALAHPSRLYMVETLAGGERCVCEFVADLGVDFSTVSRHLSILKNAGLIEDDKRGQQVFYRIRLNCLSGFLSCIEAVVAGRDCHKKGDE